jgi:hypothetical protein
VGAAVVSGHHLDILVTRPSVAAFVLDASVRKVHLVVVIRQLMLTRPASDFLRLSIGPSIAILTAAIPLLKEALVVSLELVIEDHSTHVPALLANPSLSASVGLIHRRVVG